MANFDLVDSRTRSRSNGSVKKYMDRNKKAISDAVKKKIQDSGIGEMLDGHDIEIDVKKGGYNVDEPNITYDNTRGVIDGVATGNTEYERGDSFNMQNGGKGGGRDASDGEDDVDSFKFRLTSEEFLDLVFDALELPNRIKKIFVEEDSNIYQRQGFTTEGAPSRLSILRTYKQSLGRTLAETQSYKDEIEDEDDDEKKELVEEKIRNISMFRDVDLRYTHWAPVPTIKFKCVVFFIMDVSGSMEEHEKTVSKGFFLLFVLFLRKCYNDVDIVFIRHTTTAQEVDEHTFFYDPLSGGTLMSPALDLVNTIIEERYDKNIYNIYCAQASDGDNMYGDVPVYIDKLSNNILPLVQYYIYIEVRNPAYSIPGRDETSSSTFRGIQKVASGHDNIDAAVIRDMGKLYYVFMSLFSTKNFAV